MAKVRIKAECDYLIGHLRYEHKEGILNIPDEDLDEFLKNPKEYLLENDLMCDLEFVIDDYEIDDYHIGEVKVYPVGGE